MYFFQVYRIFQETEGYTTCEGVSLSAGVVFRFKFSVVVQSYCFSGHKCKYQACKVTSTANLGVGIGLILCQTSVVSKSLMQNIPFLMAHTHCIGLDRDGEWYNRKNSSLSLSLSLSRAVCMGHKREVESLTFATKCPHSITKDSPVLFYDYKLFGVPGLMSGGLLGNLPNITS